MINENGILPTMPLAPANNATGNGMSDGAGSWIWILLIFMMMGGAGLGGLGGGANAATNMVNNDFLYTQSKIDALGQALTTQTNQLNQNMNSGFSGVNMGLCNLGHQVDSGFCSINRNIDQVRFEGAQNTCTVTNAIHEEGRLTRDLINSNTMQELRDRNGELAAALSNSQQTATIINQIRPYPTPSYLTAPPVPYALAAPHGYNPCNPCNPCGSFAC